MADAVAAHDRSFATPVSALEVMQRAAATYRARFPQVAGVAVVVFAPLAVVQVALSNLAQQVQVEGALVQVVFFLAVFARATATVFGAAFYAGLLDKVVGTHHYGHAPVTVGEALRILPYRRLLTADFLLAVVLFVGLALFVVPGFVLFTLFCLVGPIINIENESVIGAFRRSARLVRPHFWLTFLVATAPITIESLLERGVHHFVLERHSVVWAFLLNGALGATIAAWVGLIEVVLAYELVHRDRSHSGCH